MNFSNQLSKSWVGILFLVLFSIGCQRSPEARSAAYIATGKKLLQNHDPARAILQFRNAVQVTPRNAEAHYQLALAYLAADDFIRGATALRRALSLNPKHLGAQLRLAQLMTSVDDPDTLKDAMQRLEALLRDSPDNSEALHALGLTELKLGEPQDAMQHLQRAFTIAPGLWTLAATLAEAKIQQKDMQGAENVLKQACDKSPKSANAHVMLGRFYSLQKNFTKSQEEYQRALAIDSKNAAALISLATLQTENGRSQDAAQTLKQLTSLPLKEYQSLYGVFLFEQGRREEAIHEFERLSKQDPDDRLARTRLVAAYQAVNRVPDAEKLLNDVLKAHPKDLDALLQRGELRLATKKYSEAEADLLSVLHAKPDSPEAHYAVAKLHQTRNRPLMYRQELNEVLRLNPGLLPVRVELAKSFIAEKGGKAALAILDEAPENQRTLLPVIEQRNWAFLALGDMAQAREGIETGLKIARTTDLLLQEGMLRLAARNYSEARHDIKEALTNSPDDIRLLRVLVGSYAAEKQVPTAVQEVRSYAASRPNSPEIQYFLGNLLMETGDQVQAKQSFSAAKALNPGYTPAELELARINLRQANWTEARQQLTSLLSSPSGDSPLARLWLGMLEESAGRRNEAIAAFRRVVDAEPNNAIALNNLAYLLVQNNGGADEALKYAEKAQEIEPQSAYIEDTLGWILYMKAVYPSAIKYLEMANAREGTALQKFHLAMAYLKAGDRTRGNAVLKDGLRLDPKLPEAKAAQDLFNQ